MATPGTKRKSKLDPFSAEIIRNHLISTVRTMVETTRRTAYSTLFSEGLDFTCGLFDARGRMVAQALGMPTHTGTLGDTLQNIRDTYQEFHEGDVILHNDPYSGGAHQGDVAVVRPMFVQGELQGFAMNRGHWTDVGGMTPGGWSGTARDVVQEALLIPPVKLYRGGVLNREIKDLVLRNVRMAKQCWGDLQAQIASSIVAERLLGDLIDKYGREAILDGMDAAIDYSRRRFMAALEQLPNGTWEGADHFEDDGHGGGPHLIKVTATKKGRRIVVDFAGSDPQVRGPVNGSMTFTKAAAYAAAMATVDPTAPFNSGIVDLIEVRAPEGCIVNPVYPAPIYCSSADPINKTYEVVLKALGQMAPRRMSAGTYVTGNCMTASGLNPDTGEEFLWLEFESGGCGARPNKDGNDAAWVLMVNCMNESMEVWESRYPVRFEKYEMLTNSAGAGKYRGGLGVCRQMRHLTDTLVSACADRHLIPPWGLDGGREGMPNGFAVIRDGEVSDFPTLCGTLSPAKFSLVPLEADDVVEITVAGGGGYGDPLERDASLVERDVLHGYVSVQAAREEYGVWIDPATGTADPHRTEELRRRVV